MLYAILFILISASIALASSAEPPSCRAYPFPHRQPKGHAASSSRQAEAGACVFREGTWSHLDDISAVVLSLACARTEQLRTRASEAGVRAAGACVRGGTNLAVGVGVSRGSGR
ncbi:hypothetical protein SETIT_6G153500v2 [Setaria italica]|uniref:Secreted protein n=1 Tax=Setaria italica TaxID=4555 RepID=A0A368RLR9_SETIT|nr:hypothetical protein SETIT_6G153500v2 [Setaria italica]